MRKNSVRKFLHAILDLLPLFVIPIFAIYSMNHEISGNSVNTSGYEVRNKYETNEVNTIDDLVEGNIYFVEDIEIFSEDEYEFTLQVIKCDSLIMYNHSVDDEYIDSINDNNVTINALGYLDINLSEESYVSIEYGSIEIRNLYFVLINEIEQFKFFIESYEPLITASDYNVLEYVYNEGIVLDDEDIMSQFMYVTYNACDKYFNMNRVFNLGGIWNWVSNTLFSGQPPISAFIVYNVIAYEFIMDIIFLLYSVFMFVIDFAESCVDRFLRKAC